MRACGAGVEPPEMAGLGGVALQIAILAVADAVVGRDALTAVVVDPGVMLQGALGVLLLTLAAAATFLPGGLAMILYRLR